MNCKTDNLVPRAHLFSALLVALALASLTLTGCSGKKGQTASGLSTPAAASSQTQTAESGLSSAPASEAPASEASASSLPGPSAESVVSSSPEAAEAAPAYKPGDPGPNGGLVYFAQDGEFYEVFPPQAAVGVNDALPAGWVTPDMEDMTLIYGAVQKSGAADYGAHWYMSVSKAGGKNQYFRFSDGQNTIDPAGGDATTGGVRKIGVRVFDPSAAPAPALLAESAFVKSGGETAAATTTAAAGTTTAVPAGTAIAVGDKGPGGGTVFSAAGGVYKEASPLITTLDPAALGYTFFETTLVNTVKEYRGGGFSDWKIPTIEELRLVYAVRQAADFGAGWVASGTGKRYDGKGVMLQTTGITLTLNDGVIDNSSDDFPGFPGYRIVLAGGGPNTYRCINFGTGEEGGWYDEGVMLKGTGPTGALSVVAVRTFK